MGAPEVTMAWLRDQAVAAGRDPDASSAYVTEGTWVRAMWDLLAATLPPDSPGLDLVKRADLHADMSFAADAMSSRFWKDGHPVVRVNFGLSAWATELARAVIPFFVAADNANPLSVKEGQVEWATKDVDFEAAARQIAYSLSWITSRAGHPYDRPGGPTLSPVQERQARWFGVCVVLYAIAHEMAHVARGELAPEPDAAKSQAREYAADTWALERVAALGRADPDWPLNVVLPAVAIFFWTNAARAAYSDTDAPPDQTHPPALDRMKAIYAQLPALADPDSVHMFEAVALAFGAMIPTLRALTPDQLAPPGELRLILADMVPEVSVGIAPDIRLTWRTTYELAVEALLLHLAGDPGQSVSAATLSTIEGWLDQQPGAVIDALGEAYDGTLGAGDPDAAAIHDRAVEITNLLSNEYVREAIRPG